MLPRFFITAIALLLPACVCGQAAPDASAAEVDNLAVHRLLDQYAQAVDTVDRQAPDQAADRMPSLFTQH